ncbi:hypothetical protein BDW02DRAFT_611323 [Decorospora gaudefroyi]|uniref:Uncharacterized protein n=1 Tax=Decorospora gaudefroyi TaxID=184978 RepID=A0A6A5KSV7_9PLEO|nr:hypothetical protein BDW02DRAFT_611323 [Decorospora gaudefroyi]
MDSARNVSGNSSRDDETNELKERLDNMTVRENQPVQEVATQKTMLQAKSDEIFKLTGQVSKKGREMKALEDKMIELRQQTNKQVSDLTANFEREKKRWLKQEQASQEAIVGLQTEMTASDVETTNLHDQIAEVKRHLGDAQAEIKATRDTANRSQTLSGAQTPDAAAPETFEFLLVPALKTRIQNLEAENSRLKNMHKDSDCEEISMLLFQQLRDAQDLQAAAEAETEGLRHLQTANTQLTEQHVADTVHIKKLVQEKQQVQEKAKKFEDELSTLMADRHLDRSAFGGDNPTVLGSQNQTLDLSGISASSATSPISSTYAKAEIKAAQRLKAAEVQVVFLQDEVAVLQGDKYRLESQFEELDEAYFELQGKNRVLREENERLTAENEALHAEVFSKTKALRVQSEQHAQNLLDKAAEIERIFKLKEEEKHNLGFSPIQCLTSDSVERKNMGSSFSNIQTQPTSPRIPPPTTNHNISPALRHHLNVLGESIMSLSAPTASAISQRPNVALSITIKPSAKRSWALLRHVQSAISSTSSLDVHGPKELVRQFVASMDEVAQEYASSTALSEQLQKVNGQLLKEIEGLSQQLKNRPKCVNTEHLALKDELEAKEVQYQMQALMLAQQSKRNSKG